MIQTVFGELKFHIGFKKTINVELFSKKYTTVLKVSAYHESDGISSDQLEALANLKKNLKCQSALVEKMLMESEGQAVAENYKIRTILIQRDGECAFLCDDRDNERLGLAVIVYPETKILLQDEYL